MLVSYIGVSLKSTKCFTGERVSALIIPGHCDRPLVFSSSILQGILQVYTSR